MTENRIKEEKEEEKEEFRFLSAVSLLSFFFSFSTVFSKKEQTSLQRTFFFLKVVLCKLHAQFLYI